MSNQQENQEKIIKNVKFFYCHSSKNQVVYDLYSNVLDHFNEQNSGIEIIDVDTQVNIENLTNAIFSKINESDIVICDITPDQNQDTNEITINLNVLLELGYAIGSKDFSEIILLVDKGRKDKYDELKPSIISGLKYTTYESIEEIYDIIEKHAGEYNKWSNFMIVERQLTKNFLMHVDNVLDVKRTSYNLYANESEAYIIFHCNGGEPRCLNVVTKILEIKKRSIDLSTIADLNNELNHLELVLFH